MPRVYAEKEYGGETVIRFKKNEVYQEIELFDGETKIGEADG